MSRSLFATRKPSTKPPYYSTLWLYHLRHRQYLLVDSANDSFRRSGKPPNFRWPYPPSRVASSERPGLRGCSSLGQQGPHDAESRENSDNPRSHRSAYVERSNTGLPAFP